MRASNAGSLREATPNADRSVRAVVAPAPKESTTKKEKKGSAEARALERVVSAAREVQAASLRLEAHYAGDSHEQPSTLGLARFAAAMQELKDPREAFDVLVEK
ncbi:hypothetical protein F6X40_41370 [Paraburkholderia sp. UCT31]|uniref:hypothetical protein n=1 Tax=Paraburkholderia sp. UCT31 TaxID=2615209 RepID=UPI001655639A|nr:hypothetical protein [Paraburkholderia sp. UCT31]MBC8742916.1 hypothetical protein [Paraburkholderia sp. UCT31]